MLHCVYKPLRIVCVQVADAHFSASILDCGDALHMLEELDFPEELVVNTSIDKAADYIPYLNKPLYLGGQAHD